MALVFSAIALLLSVFTFLKTGGIVDIKEQSSIIRTDLSKARQQTEERMANRSILFEALYNLGDSVDSLQAGNGAAASTLIDDAIEKISSVEQRLEEKKRMQLASIRKDIEKKAVSLRTGDKKGIRELEYQIRLLRIFEENL